MIQKYEIGYVNDFVKRKYSFMIYLIPYYAIILMQIVLVSSSIVCNTNYIDSQQLKSCVNMKQLVLIVEFFWHMISDGYKVVIFLVVIDYFLNYKYYFYFAFIALAQQDISYSLQNGIYSFFVYSQRGDYYNSSEQKENSIEDSPNINKNIKIILLGIYITLAICSIIPFRKVLTILEQKHSIEENDTNLQNYNILGANKQNILENFSYLVNKKNYIIYVIIFIIFYQTSLFTWISTYQNFFFEDYTNQDQSNVFTPINNILNPIFSIIFTIYFSYKCKNQKDPFGLFLDKKMRLSATIITVFNFFMLIANSCKNNKCQLNSQGDFIQNVFLGVMLICSSFIGTASNFLLMCSVLKIAEIFNVRSKVLGSAYSIYISSLYGFEVIDYILYNQSSSNSYFSTILYSVYFALNSLSLFAMTIIHSKYHKTMKNS